jgi:hypothetical protein
MVEILNIAPVKLSRITVLSLKLAGLPWLSVVAMVLAPTICTLLVWVQVTPLVHVDPLEQEGILTVVPSVLTEESAVLTALSLHEAALIVGPLNVAQDCP